MEKRLEGLIATYKLRQINNQENINKLEAKDNCDYAQGMYTGQQIATNTIILDLEFMLIEVKAGLL